MAKIHDYIDSAGDARRCVSGTDGELYKIAAGKLVKKTRAELDQPGIDENKAAINAAAGRIILSRIPDFKQRNYLARKAELQDALIGGLALSRTEKAEWDFMATEWAWAKSVRGVSNQAITAGTPAGDVVWPT